MSKFIEDPSRPVCEAFIQGRWQEVQWQRVAKRCKKNWHVVKLIVRAPDRPVLVIPGCGIFVGRSQLRGFKMPVQF